jgi:predicted RNA binding protein YcfA (HicA-like mRNA interferase family)
MTRLPRISGSGVLSVLKKFGFDVLRTKGSHHFLRHPDGRTTVVPDHKGEVIGPGLLTKILNDCELSADDFRSKL